MSLLKNAISSLRLGLDDFNSNNDKRLLSAVRNLHAGILLLFKEKLLSLSPSGSSEVLIKQNIIPQKDNDGNIVFVGTGKKTVDTHQIKKRFDGLGISTDWKRFEKINKLRNNIEHYYSDLQRDTIRGLISDTFIIIRDFISDELHEDPIIVLGNDYWNTLLSVSEVFEKEKSDCIDKIEEIEWKSNCLEDSLHELKCDNCGSNLLMPKNKSYEHIEDIELICRSCGEAEEAEEFIERALNDYFSYDNYIAIKDGGELELVQCPHCCKESYIVSEENCAWCGETCEHTCQRCGSKILPEELNESSFCGYCLHMMNKDD